MLHRHVAAILNGSIGDRMRPLERFTANRHLARLNGAYKRFFAGTDKDQKLILRDIVTFSELVKYNDFIDMTPEQLLVMEGRRQMAMHMLRHLDFEVREFVETHNDSVIQSNYIPEGDLNE